MPRFAQRVDSSVYVFLRDENVVGVVSRNGEDGDAVVRQRLDEGEQHSGLRERERAFELEADPARAGIDTFRDVFGRANDRKLFWGAGDGGEIAIRGPVEDGPVGR